MEPQLARRNVRLGWLLFVIFLVFFAGTVAVAFIYLQFD
jgi:hypothetical protein